ncbi:MAG: hypothetical protein IPJ30_20775 [Acidobacteria bacterium]|nr:hypothetical protein [Acidobacteriota bacterium]
MYSVTRTNGRVATSPINTDTEIRRKALFITVTITSRMRSLKTPADVSANVDRRNPIGI